MKKIRQTREGSILVFSLIIMSVLLVSAIAVITVAITEKRSAFSAQKSIIAFQAADSGAERAIKRIYINNSPPILGTGGVPLDGDMALVNGDSTIDNLKNNLGNVASSPLTCSGGIITIRNNQNPVYDIELSLYDQTSTTPISCTDTAWRDKVVRLKAEGFFRGTSRVIDVGIRPRE